MQVIGEVRELLESGITPLPEYGKRCKACSLIEVCQPKLMERDRSAGYVKRVCSETKNQRMPNIYIR